MITVAGLPNPASVALWFGHHAKARNLFCTHSNRDLRRIMRSPCYSVTDRRKEPNVWYELRQKSFFSRFRHTDETFQKMSESKKGENHPNYGKPSPNRGKPLPDETRRRISESKETPKRTAARKIFFSLPSVMSL